MVVPAHDGRGDGGGQPIRPGRSGQGGPGGNVRSSPMSTPLAARHHLAVAVLTPVPAAAYVTYGLVRAPRGRVPVH